MRGRAVALFALALFGGVGCGREQALAEGVGASRAGGSTKPSAGSAAPPHEPAPSPPPDFEGNWYVLEEGQTLEQFSESIGVPLETVRARARQVDRRWLEQLERDIGRRFPDVKDAWGGRIKLPRAGVSYAVLEGEDLWALVDRFKTSPIELLIVNGLGREDAEKIRPGMRLIVPGIVRRVNGKMFRLPHPYEAAALARARELDLGSVRSASRLLFGAMEDRWREAAGGSDFSGTLAWPVAGGWYVRGYGSGEQGYHLSVDVAGNIGWPVRAVDEGIVAYVGDGIRGYGNIVMVIHPGGFVSFYAHLSASFVHAGERVKRAEILAETGSTGISRGPHVHFEFVHEKHNCDPEPLFRPGMRRRDGSMMDVKPLEWADSKPPPGLRCDVRPRRHPKSRWVVQENPTTDADSRSGLARP